MGHSWGPPSDMGPRGEFGSVRFTPLEIQEQGLKAAQWHTCANLGRGGAWLLPEIFLFHILALRFVLKLSKSISLAGLTLILQAPAHLRRPPSLFMSRMIASSQAFSLSVSLRLVTHPITAGPRTSLVLLCPFPPPTSPLSSFIPAPNGMTMPVPTWQTSVK